MKSLVIGGSSVDTIIHVPEIHSLADDMSLWATNKYTTIGGTGAGKALALDVLGAKVSFITDLGNDEYKEDVLSFFSKTKVDVYPVQTDHTTTHTNIMHSQGKRITVFTSSPTVIPPIHPQIQELLHDVDVVFLNINEFCRAYIPIIKQFQKLIVVDIHDYQEGNPYHQDFIDAADILIASAVYIHDKTVFMRRYIDQGKRLVIVTDGSNGLVAMDNNKQDYSLRGYNDFEYIDANGAGDSFCAGLMIKYMESSSIHESLSFATICGGLACTSMDLFNRDVTKKQVEKILSKIKL